MNATNLPTDFLPAEKSSLELLELESEEIAGNKLLQACLESMPEFILILNRNRQIIGGNEKFIRTFDLGSMKEILGQRFGDAIACANSIKAPSGCGTSVHCRTCGAVNSIVNCIETDSQSVNDCKLTINANQAAEFEVTASPLKLGPYEFVILALRDISAEKRKNILERIFFHDVLNTAGGIQGLVSMIADETNTSHEEVRMLLSLTERLIDEIKLQRDLLAAEKDEYLVNPYKFDCRKFLVEMKQLYIGTQIAKGKNIVVDADYDIPIYTDKTLLSRIIGNLLKNALEASSAGETVTVTMIELNNTINFSVNNPKVIPQKIQSQMFNRSFTTKSEPGHGLGTYSVKLFTEKYLGGKVSLNSFSPDGTTVYVEIPKSLQVPNHTVKSD